jgi:hypothetical protein
MTCAMMLSESCFLITTPVFDYPGQLQAVTETVAVFSSVPANAVGHSYWSCCIKLIHSKCLTHIKIKRISQYTLNDPGHFIGQCDGCFQKSPAGFKFL